MDQDTGRRPKARRPIRHLRWWIALVLFAMSFNNYIDRQTLSALSPYLKEQFSWTNEDYALVVNAFQVSYTVMQMVAGRLLDVFGTRAGVGFSVVFYTIVSACTALAVGARSFSLVRFLLGAGEAANNPGGSKAISEWFPAKERGIAVAIFNCGCALGAAAAPFIAVAVYKYTGMWQSAFLMAAFIGVLWLIAWWAIYDSPATHPRLSPEERALLPQPGPAADAGGAPAPKVGWGTLLRYRQTWGLMIGRFLLDPFWFFVAYWFSLFLKEKGFSLQQSALGLWAPMLSAGLGNFVAGGISSWLVHRGWQPGAARRVILMTAGPSMAVVALALTTDSYATLLLIFAYATFAYNCCGTMFLTLPTDVFESRAVGTVMGLAGASAGVGTLITTWLIGMVSERWSFTPVVLAASVIPALAAVVFVTMVRLKKGQGADGILKEF